MEQREDEENEVEEDEDEENESEENEGEEDESEENECGEDESEENEGEENEGEEDESEENGGEEDEKNEGEEDENESEEGEESGVCPSESTEKEDRVYLSEFILKHQHEDQSKVQREPLLGSSLTPESEAESGYSGLSFRSDRSKDIIIRFKSDQPPAVRRSPVGSDSPLSPQSYASRGSNRSTDIDLEFNFRRPIPPESYRRTNEEVQCQQEVMRQQEVQHLQEVIRHQEALLRHHEVQRQQDIKLRQQKVQHQQEVIRQQEALLRHQEVQHQQDIKLRQQEVQHQQEVICQLEIQLQAARKAKRKAMQEAERELKLKRLEDQQHLKSGKNNSHKSKRKPPGSTPSSPDSMSVDDFIRLMTEDEPTLPGFCPFAI